MIDDIPEKKDKVFFLPCPNCYVKLVATFKEINTNRTCSSCKETIFISAPPQKTPPNARIEKIIAQTELQEKSVFVSCYYCQNHQKIPAYFRGKKIYCQRCQFVLEVPSLAPAKMLLELSHREVKANGTNVVSIKARVEDKLGLFMTEEPLLFEITKSNGKNVKSEVKTNKEGKALAGYTVGIFSGITKLKVALKNHPHIFIEDEVNEKEGIGDGVIIIDKVNFFPQDHDNVVKTEIVLRNTGLEQAQLQSITIKESETRGVPQIKNLDKTFEDIILKEKGKCKILCNLRKIVEVVENIHLEIVAKGVNLKRDREVEDRTEIETPLTSKPKLYFEMYLEKEHLIAGESFQIYCKAMRNGEQDHEFKKNVMMFFSSNAITAPDATPPDILVQEKVQFENGQGVTSSSFCFYAAQSNIEIIGSFEAFPETILDYIEVFPNKPEIIDVQIETPKQNTKSFRDTDIVRVLDKHQNIIHTIHEDITLELTRGELIYKENKVETLPLRNGVASFQNVFLHVPAEVSEFPIQTEIKLLYKNVEEVFTMTVHPKPIEIIFHDIFPELDRVEQGFANQKIFLDIENLGEADFKIDSLGFQFFKSDGKNNISIDQAFYDVAPLIVNPMIPAKSRVKLTRNVHIDEEAPVGNTLFNVTVGGRDLFDGIAYSIQSECFGKWYVEPNDRSFKLSSSNQAEEIAGNPFSIKLEAFRDGDRDHFYNGKKILFVKDISSFKQEDAKWPKEIEVTFDDGEGETAPVFQFYKASPVALLFTDKDIGGASGELACTIKPGALHDFDIMMEKSQINHTYWIGENSFRGKDAYGNIKSELKAPSLSSSYELVTSENESILKYFEQKDETYYIQEQRVKLHLPWEDLPKEAEITISSEDIDKTIPVLIQPLAGALIIKEVKLENIHYEQGDATETIEILLENTGETSLAITELNIFSHNTKQEFAIELIDTSFPVSLAPKSEVFLPLSLKIPETFAPGETSFSFHLESLDTFYEEKQRETFDSLLTLIIEPNNRIFSLKSDTEHITAGSAFSVILEATIDGEIDKTYTGKHKILFYTEQQEPHKIPEYLEVVFEDGKCQSDAHFTFFSTKNEAHIIAEEKAPGGPEGTFSQVIHPGEVGHFKIDMEKQISCASFQGDIEITAFDLYGNIKTDYHSQVNITHDGDGNFFRRENAPVIYGEEFENGLAKVKANTFLYTKKHQSKKENVTFTFTASVSSEITIEMEPEPAQLEIISLIAANTVVEWEKGGYPIVFIIKNIGGAPLQPMETTVLFEHSGNKVKKGYSVTPQRTFPRAISGGEQTELSVEIELGKHIPIGEHTLIGYVKGKDLYYQKTREARLVSDSTWMVEPCGREIIAKANRKIQAGEPFGFTLEVKLEGERDKTYKGKHTILCMAEDDMEDNAQIPNELSLQFEEGCVKTEELFIYLERVEHTKIRFFESKMGAAAGDVEFKVFIEPLPKLIKKYIIQAFQFIKHYKQQFAIGTALLLFILFTSFHLYKVSQSKRVKIIEIKGTVYVSGKPAKVGDIIYAKENIKVSKNGFCALQMMNNTIVKLYGSSQIYTNKLGRGVFTSVYSPSLVVNKGEFVYNSSKKEQSKIKIPDADSLDIASNHFRLGVTGNQSRISVYKGKIAVTSGGQTVSVPKGKGSSVKKGKIPTKPVSLPKAPKWIFPEENEVIKTTVVSFQWSKIAGAKHYVLEVSTKKDFPIPISSETSVKNFQKLRDLENGFFTCQVSCITESGFASRPSKPRTFEHKFKYPAREVLAKLRAKKIRGTFQPDRVYINDKLFTLGSELRIGKYTARFEKAGFHPATIAINIEKSTAPFICRATLKTKPRKVQWHIKHPRFPKIDYTLKKLLFDGKAITSLPKEIKPGKYVLSFSIKGFKPFNKTVFIEPGKGIFTVKPKLEPKTLSVIFHIKPNIELKVFKPMLYLDGEIIGMEKQIQPGKHLLEIKHDGFQKFSKSIFLIPSDDKLRKEYMLRAIERKLLLEIEYSHPPKKEVLYSGITCISKMEKIQLSEKRKSLAPGSWVFKIEKDGYESIVKNFYIDPGTKPYKCKFALKAKPVTLAPKITFGKVAFKKVPEITLTLTDKMGKSLQYKKGLTVSPGEYTLIAKGKGLKEYTKKYMIYPQNKVFDLDIEMEVKDVELDSTVEDPARDINDTIAAIYHKKKKLQAPYMLKPGVTYVLTIWLQKHEPIKKILTLAPSDDIYTLKEDLQDFPSFVFKLKVSSMNIDGTNYSVKFYSDNRSILSELVSISNLGSSIYCTLQTSKATKKIKMEIGYYYGVAELQNIQDLELTHIDGKKLVKHLKTLNDEQKKARLDFIRDNDATKLKKMTRKGKKELLEYMKRMKGIAPKYRDEFEMLLR